jgi:hypothetical protein
MEEVRADSLVFGTPMEYRACIRLAHRQKSLLSVVRRKKPYFYETNRRGERPRGRPAADAAAAPADDAGVMLREHARVAVGWDRGVEQDIRITPLFRLPERRFSRVLALLLHGKREGDAANWADTARRSLPCYLDRVP